MYFAVCNRVCLYFVKGGVRERFLRKSVCKLKCIFLKLNYCNLEVTSIEVE